MGKQINWDKVREFDELIKGQSLSTGWDKMRVHLVVCVHNTLEFVDWKQTQELGEHVLSTRHCSFLPIEE